MSVDVSICVPNLNCRPFLPERFDTIFNQTLKDWELIVCDSYSDDGSWEYIQQLASREPRMRISQTPRKGTMAAFNDCVRLAKGEYVYIATSDDTMFPTCLEKMTEALEANPDCGLCQCKLVLIDEKGKELPKEKQWEDYTLGAYDPALVQKRNKRLAPHDGLAHPALFTIYTSLTQLLIRRSVFNRVGLFEPKWGAMGDFEWDMRAGLVENCIYIPEQLATWRIHSSQVTQHGHTVEIRQKMIAMARSAFDLAQACSGSSLSNIKIEDFIYFLERDIFEMNFHSKSGVGGKLGFLVGQLLQQPRMAFDAIRDRLAKNYWAPLYSPNRYELLRSLLRKYAVPAPVFE
jgi:glycosyltransferase involved in cell wall biosynthesis